MALPDTDALRRRYTAMADDALLHLLGKGGHELRPEALEIVREEVARRNLAVDVDRVRDAGLLEITGEELAVYTDLIRNLPCPKCGSTEMLLNGSLVSHARGALLFSTSFADTVIACPFCLKKATQRALLKTLLLGWWAGPRGWLFSIQAISRNLEAMKHHNRPYPNHFLRDFVLANAGKIEVYKGDQNKLKQLIL